MISWNDIDHFVFIERAVSHSYSSALLEAFLALFVKKLELTFNTPIFFFLKIFNHGLDGLKRLCWVVVVEKVQLGRVVVLARLILAINTRVYSNLDLLVRLSWLESKLALIKAKLVGWPILYDVFISSRRGLLDIYGHLRAIFSFLWYLFQQYHGLNIRLALGLSMIIDTLSGRKLLLGYTLVFSIDKTVFLLFAADLHHPVQLIFKTAKFITV